MRSTDLEHHLDDPHLPQEARALIDAALYKPETLASYPDTALSEPSTQTSVAPTVHPSVWLKSITVEGFRGAGEAVTLSVPACPGLTVVAARNGTGKSTLSEGLETLLTGGSVRFQDKGLVAASGWANLHHCEPVIRGEFVVGGNLVQATRHWHGSKLGDSTLTTTGLMPSEDEARDWGPVLSCGDLLQRIRGRPADVYDAIASVLGLDDFTEARSLLKTRRLILKKACTKANAHRDQLIKALKRSDLPDAERALTHVEGDDVAGVQTLLQVESTADHEYDQQLAAMKIPPSEALLIPARGLRDAFDAWQSARGQEGTTQAMLVQLLTAGLTLTDGAHCPLCAGPLEVSWRRSAEASLHTAEKATRTQRVHLANVEEAHKSLSSALRAVPQQAKDTLPQWADRPEEPSALAAHVLALWEEVHTALTLRKQAALSRTAEHQSDWNPLVVGLEQWLQSAGQTSRQQHAIAQLDIAEAWLTSRIGLLRDTRFEPLEAAALALWKELQQGSAVHLEELAMEGKKNARKLKLRVRIDGTEGHAQGVMSQGELNALTLALFLPRAQLPSNPYRFLMVDDPVQAMDPNKVGGLARVLGQVAATHQVIVLTHDERLLAALRWLNIPHHVQCVRREAQSRLVVEITRRPTEQLFLDCRRILSSSVPPEAQRRAIPGLCRTALEQALGDQLGARWIRSGSTHHEVSEKLQSHRSLRERLSLWFFDDPKRHDDMEEPLRNLHRGGPRLYRAIQAGSHDGLPADSPLKLTKLPGSTEALVAALVASAP